MMKNVEIERLRAVAVLLVINSHMSLGLLPDLPPPFHAGWPGVDLFFVISGYVITISLLKLFASTKGRTATAIKTFYTRRFFRIIPMAALWVVIPLAISAFLPGRGGYSDFAKMSREAFEIATLQYNYARPFSEFGDLMQLGPYWSLMVEEHFYLLLPLFFLIFSTDRKRLWFSLSGILVVALVLRPLIPPLGKYNMTASLFQASHRKFDALFAGVSIAMLAKEGLLPAASRLSRAFCSSLAMISLVLMWTAPYWMPWESISHNGMFVTWALAVPAVYFAVLERGIIFGFPIVGRALEYIGARSYGLYLVHTVTARFFVYEPLIDWPDFVRFAIFWGITLGIVEICYRILERPLIKYGHRLTDRWLKPTEDANLHDNAA